MREISQRKMGMYNFYRPGKVFATDIRLAGRHMMRPYACTVSGFG